MQIIPALDLLGSDAVRLEQGDFERVLFRQPISEFLLSLTATKPPMIHVVDLQGARDGELRINVIEHCCQLATETPLQVSGGIRSLETARRALCAGAQRIVVGTSLWTDEKTLSLFVEEFAEKLVVAIDVREGRLAVRGWSELASISLSDALARCLDVGVSRLHVTAIDRDGTMRGPDLSLYESICTSGIPVVAAGGVRDDNDVLALQQAGCEAAIMGVGYLARLGISLNN
ncbi:MAG: 1-(5-phosphoribosyl)-5-[(5-phosphoribosylamino)methylideneamino]imidazole-4-carboxamide isomerase [Acidimicrobiales bacterium]